MKRFVHLGSTLFLIGILSGHLHAGTPAEKLFGEMEHHLRQLHSLELHYTMEGSADDSMFSGCMIWVRPDTFYHDTPEWTLAQTAENCWRYLKNQQTLILEDIRSSETQSPEEILFALREDVEPETLEIDPAENGAQKLTLRTSEEQIGGHLWVWINENATRPFKLAWPLPDGTIAAYRVVSWREEIDVDNSLFAPPEAVQIIDFRPSKGGKGE